MILPAWQGKVEINACTTVPQWIRLNDFNVGTNDTAPDTDVARRHTRSYSSGSHANASR